MTGLNYRDTVTGKIYQPVDDEHEAYFQEWARFEATTDVPEPEPVPAEEVPETVPDPAPDAAAADAAASSGGRGKRGASTGE